MVGWEHILMPFAAAASFVAQSSEKPVRLQLNTEGEFVEIEVVGASDKATMLRYELEVLGDSITRTKGIANLAAGKRTILSKVRVRQKNGWNATLSVQGDTTYKVFASSD
jgi:hypothetical protein